MKLKEARVDYDPETGRMRSTPRQLFLELTSRCNLACVHCSKDFGADYGHPTTDLPLAALERLRPWIVAAEFVNLNGVGESLMLPHFVRAIDIANEGEARVSFNTNGINLTDSLCDAIVARRVDSVVISVDGMESNDPIRGIPYSTIRRRILALDAAKKRAGARLPNIALAFTLMRRNLHELPRLLADLLPDANIHAVHVQPLIVFYEGLVQENIYLQCEVDEVVARARALARAHVTKLILFRSTFEEDERNVLLDGGTGQLGQSSPTHGCIDPFYEIKIRSTGEVMSCSMGLMGGLNVQTMGLDEVWNHDWYRDLRRRLHAKRFEGPCHNCPYVFGSAENQVAPLRAGVHHSQESRFFAGGYGARRPAPATRDGRPSSAASPAANGILDAPPPTSGAHRAAAIARRFEIDPSQVRIVDALLARLGRCPVSFARLLEGRGPRSEDLRARLTELPYYERIHVEARAARNHEWNALTRRVLRDTVPFWVDREAYFGDLEATGRGTLADAERILVEPVLDWLSKTVRKRGGRVLVLNCGFGSLSLDLARAGLEVHGIDDNPEAIELARGVAADFPNLRLTYEAQDFDTLALEPESFDVVCEWQSLHHLEHSHRVARQAHRALRPGGVLVLQDFMAEGEGEHPVLLGLRTGRGARWIERASRLAERWLRRAAPAAANPNESHPAVARRRQLSARFPVAPEDETPAPITPVERVTGRELLASVRELFPDAQVTFERSIFDFGHIYPFVEELARRRIPRRHLRFVLKRLLQIDALALRARRLPPREFRVVATKPAAPAEDRGALEAAKREAPRLFPGAAGRAARELAEESWDRDPRAADPLREAVHSLLEAVHDVPFEGGDPERTLDRAIGGAFSHKHLSRGLRLGDRDRWAVVRGFHNAAPSEGCRWFDGNGVVLLHLPPGTGSLVIVCRRGFRRDEQEDGIPVQLSLDGRIVGTQTLRFDPKDVEETRNLVFGIPEGADGLVEAAILARSFVPHDEIGNGDRRRLAFRIERIEPQGSGAPAASSAAP